MDAHLPEAWAGYDDVRRFHEKFGFIVGDTPGHLTKRKLRERCECMMEELREFADAAGLTYGYDQIGEVYRFKPSDRDQDLAAQADALVDLVYFALGTAVMLGLPWTALWNDVQRANMAKVRGVKPARQHAVDVVKPTDWVGPKTADLLAEAGYVRDDWAEQHQRTTLTGQRHTVSTIIDEGKCRDD